MRLLLIGISLVTSIMLSACTAPSGPDENGDTPGEGTERTDRSNTRSNRVDVCHYGHTTSVLPSQVAGHLAHGDYRGACRICTPGATGGCYPGPWGTQGRGTCRGGSRTCNSDGMAWGACTGAVVPAAETCGDHRDTNCNGDVDEGCECGGDDDGDHGCGHGHHGHHGDDDRNCACVIGDTATCYTGPAGTEDLGTCHDGAATCNDSGSGYGACLGSVVPVTEICGDGLDNDCDGQIDQGCVCPPGETWACYGAPLETDGIGACQRGIKTCNADGLGYGACVGEIDPVDEICGNGVDDDCDHQTDEGCGVCEPGATMACYGGSAGTAGVGVCVAGAQICAADGSGYGACLGEVQPSAEVCGNDLDDDCDGTADEGCVCAAGSSVSCYEGPAGTAGVGACQAGSQFCNALGTGYGVCVGSVTPVEEVCGDGIDNDCDGVVDDGCVCAAGSSAACYDGPAGTDGVGSCSAGTRLCNADGTAYGACVGAITPTADTCGDGADNDCDGVTDDGCVCAPGSSAACYDGPTGTDGVGTCRAGSQLCNADGSGYGACVGTVTPAADVCGDGLDSDCDGFADEGCVCTAGAVSSCYSGPPATQGVGTCADGAHACNVDGTGYDACVGSVTPVADVCGDGRDNNCDGRVDETCVCAPSTVAACYDGPVGTAGVGTCHAGTRICNATGSAYGLCTGAVGPARDICGNGLDEDCDGVADDGCIGDRAWRDATLTGTIGVQDPGEPGIGSAIFLLRTASGGLVAVTSSGPTGIYFFEGIPAGNYYIEVIPPSGTGVTSPNIGNDDNLDSDFDGEGLNTATFAFTGAPNRSIDCGFTVSGT